MPTAIDIRLVPADRLVRGKVNTWSNGDSIRCLIADTAGVDPLAVPALIEVSHTIEEQFPAIRIPGVTPLVRCHLEPDLGGALAHAELSPHLISVYLAPELMPQDVADELAGHGTALLRDL